MSLPPRIVPGQLQYQSDAAKSISDAANDKKATLGTKVMQSDFARKVMIDADAKMKFDELKANERRTYRVDQSKKQNDKAHNVFDKSEYGIEQESDTGDINNNTINDILTNVFSGNLFDAGVSAISTKNIHSSWYIAKRPIVDENKYNFLYNLDISSGSVYGLAQNAKEANITNITSLNKYLDSMEDPTILGYSLMIDEKNSILFNNADVVEFKEETILPVSNNTTPTRLNENSNEASLSDLSKNKAFYTIPTTQTNDKQINKRTTSDILKEYLFKYYNTQAVEFLTKFRKDIMRVFVTPSVIDNGELYKGGLRNHYVKSIEGLDKLDKMFVKYSDTPEVLTLNLYEDVRLFTTNLKFMYNNFVYNYNQGIRVVPENLVKFNMFIKIAEKRNYALHYESDDVINKHTPTLIYQLHGCEFIFDESIVGSTVTMMGSDVNDTYAVLKIKISYKKVTRIFDKPYAYSDSATDWIIDDTYNDLSKYHPSNFDMIAKLQTNGFRSSLSNEMATTESLRSKISKFTNGGILKPGENKTLAGKFASTLGNNAIKAGSQFVEEQAKKAKNAAQSEIASAIDRNPILSGISNNVKNLLKSNIVVSTKNLKTMLPTNSIIDQNGFGSIKNDIRGILGANQIQNKSEVPAFVSPSSNFMVIGGVDEWKYDIDKDGKTDRLDVSKQKYEDEKNKFETKLKTLNYDVDKDGDLDILDVSKQKYEDEKNKFIASKEDIVLDNENSVQKYADMVKKYLASKEDIVPNGTNTNILPNVDLSNGIKNNNVLPKENLNDGSIINENKFTINDIVPDSDYKPTLPKQDLSK